MVNTEGLHRLFQHILASAALSEDFRGRQLGPIHFLKYAYLADLAFAERNEGETFTALDWRFYHFGPWSEVAFRELPTALEQVEAAKFVTRSRYEGDFARFGLEQEQAQRLIQDTEHDLPFVVSNAIAQSVHEHGSDTADLLRRIYLTWPMLSAKPGQVLDFRPAVAPDTSAPDPTDVRNTTSFSKSRKKARSALIKTARSELARRLARPPSRVPPHPLPRYDEVFAEGTRLLDQLAGEPPQSSVGELTFNESIWKSDQRCEPDVP